MALKSLVVNAGRCTGCRTCEMACSLWHEDKCSPRLSRVRVIKWEARGISVPAACANCTTPYCMLVCPVGAVSVQPENGALIMDGGKCIGCRACSTTCPLGQAIFHPEKRIAIKCDLCEGDPACARFCPSGALDYTTVDQSLMAKRRQFYKKVIEGGDR